MAFFTITSDAEFQGATVIFPDGSTQTIGSDNPNYQKVIDALLPTQTVSDDELLEMISPFELIYRKLTKLSERVSRKGMRLFFDGDAVANALALHIIKIMDAGAPESEWQAYIKFWEKVATNPSTRSQDELFLFIEKHGLLLTPDGDAVFYKSTRADGTSTYAGYGIVDGVEYEHDHIPNHVGAVVEIPRSKVDDNRGIACSVGLHVGDYTYANTYSERLWTVLVNPRDVVSVPSDANERKIRVCRYTIIEENADRVKYDGTIKVFDTPEAPEEEPDEEEEETPQVLTVNVKTQKLVYPEGSRVPEYISLIQSGGAGKDLRKFRNKRVTAGRRTEFDEAVKALGLQY